MTNEKVQLCLDYIGEGETLFIVTVGGSSWEGDAIWLVAADSLEQAQAIAKAQYPEDSELEWWDGAELGRIL